MSSTKDVWDAIDNKATEEVDSKWNSCRCHGAGCHQCRERDE